MTDSGFCHFFRDLALTGDLLDAGEQGRGVPKDTAKAAEMLGKASDMGCLESSLALGRLLLSQIGESSEVTAEASRGFSLIRRVADAGDIEAIREAADLLTTGRGVERNDSAASMYRMLADQAEQGAPTPFRLVALLTLLRCIHAWALQQHPCIESALLGLF